MWDLSVSETVASGESYDEAAIRGLKEELGISISKNELTFLFSFKYRSAAFNNNSQVYSYMHGGKIVFDSGEIDEITHMSSKEVSDLIKNNVMAPDATAIWLRFLDAEKTGPKLDRFDASHDEYVDIVDEDDRVVGNAHWKDMMEKHLLHRTSNTIVLNSKGEIFVHRRADNLKLYPGMWDVKFGGSVRAGESYEEAAKRELKEEAGIDNPIIHLLFRLKSRRMENMVNRAVFKCVYDGEISLDESEVAEGRFMKLDEVKSRLERKMSPSAIDVLSEYLKVKDE